ncbi:MAG: D-Ala-D-Ala dipeptidase [Alphaproteobacteria bacterium]|nr:D-Ala-D-Ala dipeptidase [Alphaproteobacteria bacterium]MDE2337332.1 D-Ala-D-Ala dipeptidase [Alphaproteobacteria bacterium]
MTGPAPQLKAIAPDDLVALEDFTAAHPLKIDLVYAQPAHPDNMFGEKIYRADARMLAHREFSPVIIAAADICHKKTGWVFELKDCLRTVEAQALMRETKIVKAHPQWLEEPGRLLSPPGAGGHPRGMAADIVLVDENGDEIDMGTRFDFLTEDRANNPAARNYTRFSDDEARNQRILYHRRVLEEAMMDAAKSLGRELLPLPQEWWDFRFPYAYTNTFAPVRDAGLPEDMRMTETA